MRDDLLTAVHCSRFYGRNVWSNEEELYWHFYAHAFAEYSGKKEQYLCPDWKYGSVSPSIRKGLAEPSSPAVLAVMCALFRA